MPTLEWIGKEKVINHHQQVPYRVLAEKYRGNPQNMTVFHRPMYLYSGIIYHYLRIPSRKVLVLC